MGHRTGRSPGAQAARSQHFLRDAALARALVERTGVRPGTTVFEPGAGTGILTQALADRGCRVVAVERDPRLFRALRARFIGRTNVECHLGDALDVPLPRGPYAVVANVPFAITAALVRRLLDARHAPEQAWLIVQREAAEKYAGVPRMTLFALHHAPLFDIDLVAALPRDHFRPPPSVDCALLRVRRRNPPLLQASALAPYRALVRAAFGRHEPDVRRSLRTFFTPTQLRRLSRDLGFPLDARAHELRSEHWLGLWRFLERERAPNRRRRGAHVICRGSPEPVRSDFKRYVGKSSRSASRTSAAMR
jgi:23S rRNA (adenine-N6)-dimethyltransferase